jgi:hypothetical protein
VAYDEDLGREVAEIVTPWGATRKAMFGGTGYLLRGNMVGGVLGRTPISAEMSPPTGSSAPGRSSRHSLPSGRTDRGEGAR